MDNWTNYFLDHPFWFALTAACVIWYSTITVYVAIRGVFDIKGMLKRLQADSPDANEDAAG